MNKIKMQKGITLIALIITIIVLLILAVVTIGSIKDSDIIKYAQNAAGDYNKAKEEENGILDGYIDRIEDSLSSDDKEKEKYYDISFLDLSTSGYTDMTATSGVTLIFMFESYDGTKGYISIAEGTLGYFIEPEINIKNGYAYVQANNNWIHFETPSSPVNLPPLISKVKFITDETAIQNTLEGILADDEEMYTWARMTDDQISKIVTLTEHEEFTIGFPITGKVGENATGTITSDGVLTISGAGEIYTGDYENSLNLIHNVYSSNITDLYEGAVSTIYSGLGYVPESYEQYVSVATIDEIKKSVPVITKVIIGEGITYIGDTAFQAMEKLDLISIPSTVTYLGKPEATIAQKIVFEGRTNVDDLDLTEWIEGDHYVLSTNEEGYAQLVYDGT